ncbi:MULTISPECIES: type II toxin-antitoxin system HicA family toxin [unclassified Sphingomonas]|uniref:type II toxin-antitoxin system HicA family toxin n=1 Tax=unclassified Sphingomonas TaxID=196159 RepID=UPI000B04B000|nr:MULTISPECIES: type II toxin-antitoxin system HicA family toxin [unclassified Sphingomonas]
MIKRLERLGFEQIRQRGSHVILRRGTVGCVVPIHDPLKKGTMAGILRQAHVSREEFVEAAR